MRAVVEPGGESFVGMGREFRGRGTAGVEAERPRLPFERG
jgi:hypothetical protein